jgi:hypothetical protein
MKPLVLAMAVGGLAGLAVGEREVVVPDPWLGEALHAFRGGDFDRALHAAEGRLLVAPTDAAARVLQDRFAFELDCARKMRSAEHALAIGDRAWATFALERIGTRCRQHPFAVTRLEQIGAP